MSRTVLRSLLFLSIPLVLCFAQARKSEEFPTSAGAVRLTPIEHAAVLLEAAGRAIYIDPASGNYDGLPKADLLIVTDIHPDHLVPATIDKLKKDSTLILAPEAVAKTLTTAQVMHYGDSREWNGWTIEAVAAYNTTHGPSAGTFFHDKGRGNGYVFTYGGKRLYISGDTEGTPEMASLKNIDVALVCMNSPYTMSPEEAAAAVRSFKPKLVIPYHYRGSDLSVFQKALAGSGVEVRLLEFYPNGQGGAPGTRGGQPVAPGGAQAGGNPGGAQSAGGRGGAAPAQPGPLVLADGRVTFRLAAPKASDVTVAGDFWLQQTRVEHLAKDSQGIWSITIDPLKPGFYSYWFVVDGVSIPDPGNGFIKPGVRATQSAFQVPGPEDDWEALKDVPHGDVRMIWYPSAALGDVRRMHIYLPPGYDTGTTRYPVLYLMAGGGDTDDGWISIGRLNLIMDNLIAAKKAQPMIIVLPYNFAVPQSSPDYPNNSTLFAKELFQDIIPYVEKRFRTSVGSAHRAFGGIPMPYLIPDVAFSHIDQFNTLCFIGNGVSADRLAYYDKTLPGVLDNPSNVKRVTILIGDGVNASTYNGSKSLADAAKQRGYQSRFFQNEGIHGWPWFRREFFEEAQALFQGQ